MKEKLASIVDLIRASRTDEAKKEVEALAQAVKSDRDRGSLMALAGILASISKGKDGTLQSWESAKVARAANTIKKSQLADDWDRGYAEVLSAYSRPDQKGK